MKARSKLNCMQNLQKLDNFNLIMEGQTDGQTYKRTCSCRASKNSARADFLYRDLLIG